MNAILIITLLMITSQSFAIELKGPDAKALYNLLWSLADESESSQLQRNSLSHVEDGHRVGVTIIRSADGTVFCRETSSKPHECTIKGESDLDAQELLFSSDDIQTIELKLSELLSGQSVEIGNARCKANSFADLPGYSCLFSMNEQSVTVESTDIVRLKKLLSTIVSGGGTEVLLLSQKNIFCKNNTFAERPGYRCYTN